MDGNKEGRRREEERKGKKREKENKGMTLVGRTEKALGSVACHFPSSIP